jgi:hypothetical protein
VSESAASAKRVWFMFGAKPAQSETPVRARGQAGVHPEEGAVERRREATYGWLEEQLREGSEWKESSCVVEARTSMCLNRPSLVFD